MTVVVDIFVRGEIEAVHVIRGTIREMHQAHKVNRAQETHSEQAIEPIYLMRRANARIWAQVETDVPDHIRERVKSNKDYGSMWEN